MTKSKHMQHLAELSEAAIHSTTEWKFKQEEIEADQNLLLRTIHEENLKIRLANAQQKTREAEDTLRGETERLNGLRAKNAESSKRQATLRDTVTQKVRVADDAFAVRP